MDVKEVTMLLARIQVLDNRQVDALTIEAWTPLMANIDYNDAVAAVNRHFAESTEYLKPAHIVSGVKSYRKALLPTTMSPEHRDCTQQGRPAHVWMKSGMCVYCTVVRHDR